MLLYEDFITAHRCDDVRDLALRQSRYPEVCIPYVVQQIAAWQTAKKKLPLWAETEGIEYPVHLSMEQCSSQLTAQYKASIVGGGESMTDLTAGFGVDATILARKYKHLNYVERDEELCKIQENNLPLLGIESFTIINGDGTEVLKNLSHQSLIYLDPARRDEHGGKTIAISDCTPDVSQLQDMLIAKADVVMVKLSPMLNLSTILQELKSVSDIHVVSVDNECKEILVVMKKEAENTITKCVNIAKGKVNIFEVPEDDRTADCHYSNVVLSYLYEPNTSIMKVGCFRSLARAYKLDKVHPDSHLYTSNELISNFPGRIFKVTNVLGLKDKRLKHIKKANITVRNFPQTVAELRKRLKTGEGGSDYLFATTLADDSKVIITTSTILPLTP